MKILVLGGTGFLSSAIVSELLTAGHEVSILTRGQRGVPAGVRALVADRRDSGALAGAAGDTAYDAVIDCLCFSAADAETAVRAFRGRVSRYVMISTNFVYGVRRVLPITEDTPTHALSEYGREKVHAEAELLDAWRSVTFPVSILRPPHIMGEGGHLGTGSLQGRDPQLLDRLQQRGPVPLLDSGALLIQPVHHRDVARACLAVIGTETTLGRTYNVAGPDCVTTREYYDLIAKTLGVTDPHYLSLSSTAYVEAYPEKAPFAQHWMLSVERLAEDAGFRPETSLAHCVFETVDWLQATESAEPYVESDTDRALLECDGAYRDVLRGLL